MGNCRSYEDIQTELLRQKKHSGKHFQPAQQDNEREINSKWVNKRMVRLSPSLFISIIKKCLKTKKGDFSSVAKKGTPALCNKQEYKPLSYYKS